MHYDVSRSDKCNFIKIYKSKLEVLILDPFIYNVDKSSHYIDG